MSDFFSVESDPPASSDAESPSEGHEPTHTNEQASSDEQADDSPGGNTSGTVVRVPGDIAVEPTEPWSLPFRRKLMGALDGKGISAATLIFVALAVAGIAAMCISIQHHGFGALLGLAAVAVAWIARTPRRLEDGTVDPAVPFVLGVSEAVPALLAGGFVLDISGVAFHVLVRTALLVGLMILPLLRALDEGRNLPRGPVLLSWAERLSLLLVGALLGNPKLMVLLVTGLVVADVVTRVTLMRPRAERQAALPPGLASCFGPDGALLTPIRWGILAVSVLLCLVFGTEDGWGF